VRRGSEEDAERLRSDLLDAAMQLFAEGGIEGVSVRAIAAKLGISPMAMYRYFADKTELLRGLWQFVNAELLEWLKAAEAGKRGGRTQQRAVFEAFLGYWEEHPQHFWLVYLTQGSMRPRPDKSPASQNPVYAEILALMRRATEGLAAQIGADTTWVKLSDDIAFAMLLGYLQSAFVNQRYPWTDRAQLRAAFINQLIAAKESCLLHGLAMPPLPAKSTTPRRR